MRASRLEYNEAVQVSERRELLLNLVRLRYSDAPEFLAISAISTQMNFEVGASISGEFGEVEESNSAFATPGASVGYSETPTITFTPQREQEFTRQLVAAVELDSVYLLTQYGWGIDRVLRLVARSVNDLENFLSRETRSTSQEGSLNAFTHAVSLLRHLEEEGLVSIDVEHRRDILSAPIPLDSVTPDDLLRVTEAGYRLELQADPPAYVLSGSRQHYVLRVSENAWDNIKFVQAALSLGLPLRQTVYDIDPGGSVLSDPSNGRLSIVTRSVLGTMAYLSNGVLVPDVHKNQGLVSESGKFESTVYDLLKIHVSASPVDNAYLVVPYRGHWFYVDDSDLNTKRTLGLLNSLIRLTINAGGAQNVPVLTLPLSR